MIWYVTLLSHFSNHQLWVCQSLGGFVSFKLPSGVHVSRIKIDDLTLNCLNSGTVYINCSQLRLWWHSTPPITNPEPLNNDVWRTTVLFEIVPFHLTFVHFRGGHNFFRDHESPHPPEHPCPTSTWRRTTCEFNTNPRLGTSKKSKKMETCNGIGICPTWTTSGIPFQVTRVFHKDIVTTIVHLRRASSWNLCELTPMVRSSGDLNGHWFLENPMGNQFGEMSSVHLSGSKISNQYKRKSRKDLWCSWIICRATCGGLGETCLFETTLKPPLGKYQLCIHRFLLPNSPVKEQLAQNHKSRTIGGWER